jgi:hypothetical protein
MAAGVKAGRIVTLQVVWDGEAMVSLDQRTVDGRDVRLSLDLDDPNKFKPAIR